MPTYEYECEKCGLIFEEFQSITAQPLSLCKAEGCGGKVKKLFSPGAGFIFKGNGFYTTDYRSESYKKAAGAEKTGGTSNEKSSSSAEKKSPPSSDSAKSSGTGSSTKSSD